MSDSENIDLALFQKLMILTMMTRVQYKDKSYLAHLAIGISRKQTKFVETDESCTKDVILLVITISVINVVITKDLVFLQSLS